MKKLMLLLPVFCACATSHAYDIETHAMLTYQAYLQSSLKNDSALLQNLGLDYLNPNNPFGEYHREWAGYSGGGYLEESKRNSPEHEDLIIKDALWKKDRPGDLSTALTIPAWLMRGAVREDDGAYAYPVYSHSLFGFSGIWLGAPTQPREEGVFKNISRFCNHFFDPTKPPLQEQFTGGCPSYPATVNNSLNWALGINNAFAEPAQADAQRLNHFSLLDTKEALHRAITGSYEYNGKKYAVDFNGRRQYWATVFRSLGGIMHLIEDAGQPQHTRNEGHAGVGWIDTPAESNGIKGNNVYEKYTNARVLRAKEYTDKGLDEKNLTPPIYTGYPIPKFTYYRDFWTSGQALSQTAGKGLADYSNRGFFTVGNNINNIAYAQPSPKATDYTVQEVESQSGGLFNWTYKETFLVGPVKDYKTNTTDANIKMVRAGAFSDFFDPVFSADYFLDRKVFDDHNKLLLPRATAYAAGFVNHFFRGKIEITPPEGGVYGIVDHATLGYVRVNDGFSGFGAIKVKLKNTTPDNEAMPNGTLLAVLKFKRNYCYTDDLRGYLVFPKPNGNTPYDPNNPIWKCLRPSGATQEPDEEIVLSDPIANVALSAAAQEFKFNFTRHLPINASNVRLQIVYRGQLGVEPDAVVVATQDISEPTFYTRANTFNILDFKGNAYSVDQFNASQTLLHSLPSSYINDKTNPHSFDTRPLLGTESIASNMRFGTNGPVVSVPALRYGEFFRIALLSNAGESIQTTVKGCGGSDEVLDIASSTYQSYITNSPIGLYSAYLNFKGQFVSYSLTLCRFTIDSIPYDEANNAGGYSGSPPKQVPATITGF